MNILLKNGSLELEEGSTCAQAAHKISEGLVRSAVAAR